MRSTYRVVVKRETQGESRIMKKRRRNQAVGYREVVISTRRLGESERCQRQGESGWIALDDDICRTGRRVVRESLDQPPNRTSHAPKNVAEGKIKTQRVTRCGCKRQRRRQRERAKGPIVHDSHPSGRERRIRNPAFASFRQSVGV